MTENDIAQWRQAIGPRAGRYLEAFRRIEAKGGGWVRGWNSSAFFHSTAWFCYRRMFGFAFLNLCALPLLFLFLAYAGRRLFPEVDLDGAALALLVAYLVTVFLLVPVYADSIYYRVVKQRIEGSAEQVKVAVRRPSLWTGLGATGLGVVWVLMAGGVLASIPGGYTARARVSEGLLGAMQVKSAVNDFFEKEKRLPRMNEISSDAAPAYQTSEWVRSIVFDPSKASITVTMSDPLPGKRFALVATVQDGKLVWTCHDIDIGYKNLPAHCRNRAP